MDISTLRPLSYSDGVISINNIGSHEDAKRAFEVFLEAVLDNHVPITKPIGFSLEAPVTTGNRRAMRFIGSGYTLESVPEIANKLSSLIVLGWDKTKDKRVYTISGMESKRGDHAIPVVTGPELYLAPSSADGEKLSFLQQGVEICRMNNSKVILRVVLATDTGFKDMGYTSHIRWVNESVFNENSNTESKYFFMNVNFSLIDCVRILPPDGNEFHANGGVHIKVKFLNGMNFYIFEKLWAGMFEDPQQVQWLTRRLK